MRDRDLADSPLASCSPEEPDCDSLRDFLAEPFTEAARAMPPADGAAFRALAGQCLDRGLAAAADAGFEGTGAAAPDALAVLVKVLQFMSRDADRHYALRAICYLRLLGHEGRSFQAIADEFHVTRADVHTIYRSLQRRHPQLRSRGDKSDRSREACRLRRIGARKTHEPWSISTLWRNPIPLSLAV